MNIPSIEGVEILSKPSSRHVNLVYRIKTKNGDRYFLKFFVDALHPNLQVYDCASREVFAYRLSERFGNFIPETDFFGPYRFGIIIRDKGNDFAQYSNTHGVFPYASEGLLRQLALVLVFSHWIRDYERAPEHLILDSKEHLYSIDYSFCGPGGQNDPSYSAFPWLKEKIGIENIEFDDIERIGHFRGIMSESNHKKTIGRMILDNYKGLLDFKYFDEPISRIEEFPSVELKGIVDQFDFYRRRKMKGTIYEPMKDDGSINDIYYDQLVTGKTKLRNVFKQWIEWMEDN